MINSSCNLLEILFILQLVESAGMEPMDMKGELCRVFSAYEVQNQNIYLGHRYGNHKKPTYKPDNCMQQPQDWHAKQQPQVGFRQFLAKKNLRVFNFQVIYKLLHICKIVLIHIYIYKKNNCVNGWGCIWEKERARVCVCISSNCYQHSMFWWINQAPLSGNAAERIFLMLL